MKELKVIWFVLVIGLCAAFGAVIGWNRNGLPAAIVLGIVGACFGVVIAVSPAHWLR